MPAKKSTRRYILTAVCVDIMGCAGRTPEQEIDDHVDYFSRELDAVLDWYRVPYIGEKVIKPKTEMIIFDYGGMSYGNDLMACNSRDLIKWAMDHPNSLVLVASSFTYDNGVKYELDALGFKELPNVIMASIIDEGTIPEWFRNKTDGPGTPTPEPVCMRCHHRVMDDRLLYERDGESHICSKCQNLVCSGCYDEKKKKCGDCLKW